MTASRRKIPVKLARLFWQHRLYSIAAVMFCCLTLWSVTLFTISTDRQNGNNNLRAMLTPQAGLQANVLSR